MPVDQYKNNLTRIINHAHIKSHAPTILLVTPPPVDERTVKELGHEARSVDHTALYAEAVREITREIHGVVLIDLWKAVFDEVDSSGRQLDQLFTDGLHLNGEGYRIFYDLVAPHIPEGGTSQYVYPDWQDLS